MNIYFGKISTKFEKEQIEGGYYIAPKNSSWFSDIQIGDYTFLIGGNKMQFWKAKEWGVHKGKECLLFEIINNNLGIKTNRFSALKFLSLTTDIIIHTSRSAKNRAFFKLNFTKKIDIKLLSDSNFYKDENLYRKIKVHKNEKLIIENSEDLQFFYKNDTFNFYPNNFTESRVISNFIDNLKLGGKGAKNKDRIISKIKNKPLNPTSSFSYKEISMRSIYDTFFCEYIIKEKYYVVGAYWFDNNPTDQTLRFIKNNIWENGYDNKYLDIVKNIPKQSNIAIKTIDRKGDKMHIKAIGTVTKNHNDGKILDVEWEDNFDEFKLNFSGGYWDTITEITHEDHINAIWNNNEYQELNTNKTTENMSSSFTPALNQILYGPPGTGKTFYLKDKLFDKYTTKETSISKEQNFESIISSCSWWQVIAIALLDLKKAKVSDIFEHSWIQKKADLSNSKTIRPTLWGQLQSHTINECEFVNVSNKQQPLIFSKTNDSYWEILEEEVKELVPELYELKNLVDNFEPNPDKIIKNYDFVTFHQSFAYEDFIEGIKPNLPENEEETKELSYRIQDGVFKKLCLKAEKSPDNRFAIFIDEINRGNVSAIFGELITLIEQDKRKGAKNEMNIKLPYSKKEFNVPSNLDIFGTMNTADRSVEALDTALRRRFEFKEMMPDSNLLKKITFDSFNLKEVLETINNRIELLLDRDHTIGHSYFIAIESSDTVKLASTFNNKVVPLLQEYFYNDYEKIGLVLGEGFIEKLVDNKKVTFPNFIESDNFIPEVKYRLKIKDTEFDIIEALKKLTTGN